MCSVRVTAVIQQVTQMMKPAARNSSKVCVQGQQSVQYERLSHDFVDRRPFARVQM